MKSPREVIDAHYAAGDRRDVPGMISNLASDIVWTEAAGSPVGGTHVGVDSVREDVFGILAEHFYEWTVAIDELIVEGETVIGLGTFAATSRATGKPVTTRVAQIWRVREGRAVAFEHIIDTAAVTHAMTNVSSWQSCAEGHAPCALDQ